MKILSALSRITIILLLITNSPALQAQQNSAADITAVLSAVVGIEAEIPASARTAATLGSNRSGSGVLIDNSGLILTVGYLILEAAAVNVRLSDGALVAAEIVAYDHDTGFGLVRALEPLANKPMKLGQSAALKESDKGLVIAFGGPDAVRPATVVSRRTFAGYWEYLLENAIFTVPPHPLHSGAALVGPSGELLGIGSLIVNDAFGDGQTAPGNMFVPIEHLESRLGDLLALGRASPPPRPWLGLFPTEYNNYVFIAWLAEDGPAAKAGLAKGELIVAVGDKPVRDMGELYREVWAQGSAGVEIPLIVLRGAELVKVQVKSDDRYNWLRLKPSL